MFLRWLRHCMQSRSQRQVVSLYSSPFGLGFGLLMQLFNTYNQTQAGEAKRREPECSVGYDLALEGGDRI